MELFVSLIAGAVGGNVAGGIIRKFDIGPLGNTIAGLLGGGIGGQIFGMMGTDGANAGGMDIGSIIGQVASGGVGGGALLAIVGVVKGMMNK